MPKALVKSLRSLQFQRCSLRSTKAFGGNLVGSLFCHKVGPEIALKSTLISASQVSALPVSRSRSLPATFPLKTLSLVDQKCTNVIKLQLSSPIYGGLDENRSSGAECELINLMMEADEGKGEKEEPINQLNDDFVKEENGIGEGKLIRKDDGKEKQEVADDEETKLKKERELEEKIGPPPEKPLPGDCCGQGCEVCIWDTYWEELDDYKKLRKAAEKSG